MSHRHSMRSAASTTTDGRVDFAAADLRDALHNQGDKDSRAMAANLRRRVTAVNALLAAVYGEDTRLSVLLERLGASSEEIRHFREHAVADACDGVVDAVSTCFQSLRNGGRDFLVLSRRLGGLCRFVWNLPPDALDRHRCRATPSRIAARVDGAVKGGRSPAKRTLYCVRNANTLNGLGLVAASRGPAPEPVRRRGLPRPRGGVRGGAPEGLSWGDPGTVPHETD
jgi:hypothetical protein